MEGLHKFLTEAMGICWHEFKIKEQSATFGTQFEPNCFKCGESPAGVYNFTLDNWEGFGKLWTWATSQNWWNEFMFYQNTYSDDHATCWISSNQIKGFVDPENFAKAVAHYLQKK